MTASLLAIDSFELARSRRQIEGDVPIVQMPRLAEFVPTAQGDIRYKIAGLIDDEGHPAANLHVAALLTLTCQRCNGPLEFALDRTMQFRFVDSEEELNSLPIEDDEVDAVVGSKNMSIYDWVEDEVILSLPLVPRHEECALPLASDPDLTGTAAPNPFAALIASRSDDGARH
ncbi:MAG TPA: YceD family protein [Burkholderiaceae bacterium]|jgi:uncharacterized protein|nr:YceD family protein [Burkholderiaceae bacterium]